ncbi:hypothetical protein NC652_028365 [Populus alba x Populus x berolinensis]|nr:hypothetical protein NC652_028365 [Populus alba x Populus x berolinensis]
MPCHLMEIKSHQEIKFTLMKRINYGKLMEMASLKPRKGLSHLRASTADLKAQV